MKLFVALKDPDDSLPPQAKTIVSTIRSSSSGMTRINLVQMLSDGRLNTRQPASRILSFYAPSLTCHGFIRCDDAEEAPQEKEMKKPVTITIKLTDPQLTAKSKLSPPGDTLARPVLRGFESGFQNDLLLVCGEDQDDHDIWLVRGETTKLVGTLNHQKFHEVCKAKDLELGPGDFEWLSGNMLAPGTVLSGKHCATLHRKINGASLTQVVALVPISA